MIEDIELEVIDENRVLRKTYFLQDLTLKNLQLLEYNGLLFLLIDSLEETVQTNDLAKAIDNYFTKKGKQ